MAADGSTPAVSIPVRIGRELDDALQRIQEHIRQRAYQIFLGREPDAGDAEADWLEAQVQLIDPVELVLKEQKKNIVVEAMLGGFKPTEVDVEVGVDALTVCGSHTESHKRKKGSATSSSTEVRHFYQQVPLPCEVDVDACHARLLKNGKLKITLPKKSGAG